MAKVTFEFNRDFSKKCSDTGHGMEGIDIRLTVTDLNPKDESGPQDVLAHIVAAMGNNIIDAASKQLLAAMKEHGVDAFCTRYPSEQH